MVKYTRLEESSSAVANLRCDEAPPNKHHPPDYAFNLTAFQRKTSNLYDIRKNMFFDITQSHISITVSRDRRKHTGRERERRMERVGGHSNE